MGCVPQSGARAARQGRPEVHVDRGSLVPDRRAHNAPNQGVAASEPASRGAGAGTGVSDVEQTAESPWGGGGGANVQTLPLAPGSMTVAPHGFGPDMSMQA